MSRTTRSPSVRRASLKPAPDGCPADYRCAPGKRVRSMSCRRRRLRFPTTPCPSGSTRSAARCAPPATAFRTHPRAAAACCSWARASAVAWRWAGASWWRRDLERSSRRRRLADLRSRRANWEHPATPAPGLRLHPRSGRPCRCRAAARLAPDRALSRPCRMRQNPGPSFRPPLRRPPTTLPPGRKQWMDTPHNGRSPRAESPDPNFPRPRRCGYTHRNSRCDRNPTPR